MIELLLIEVLKKIQDIWIFSGCIYVAINIGSVFSGYYVFRIVLIPAKSYIW